MTQMWYTLEEFLGNFNAFKRQKKRWGWHGNYLDYLLDDHTGKSTHGTSTDVILKPCKFFLKFSLIF